MAVQKRLVGDALNLKMLLADLDSSKFVRAFLTDKSGASLVPASVDLVSSGDGLYTETTTVMQNVEEMNARLVVYDDSGFLTLDCFHAADLDVYERENLLPSQLPGTDDLKVDFGETANLEAALQTEEIKAEISTEEISVNIQSEDELFVTSNEPELAADLETDELKANLD